MYIVNTKKGETTVQGSHADAITGAVLASVEAFPPLPNAAPPTVPLAWAKAITGAPYPSYSGASSRDVLSFAFKEISYMMAMTLIYSFHRSHSPLFRYYRGGQVDR